MKIHVALYAAFISLLAHNLTTFIHFVSYAYTNEHNPPNERYNVLWVKSKIGKWMKNF